MTEVNRPRFPRNTEQGKNAGILAGIKVLDFTRLLSGPVATQMLGDLGADILKVESAQGDDTRLWGPYLDEQSGSFLCCNRNKYSITANLKDPVQLEEIRDLVRKADVIVENFAAGVMKRLGLSYEDCVALNPSVIYCSISGYGQKGMFAGRPGYDAVFQSESGLMSLTGMADGEPTRTGTPITDYTTGVFASNAITAALYHRMRSGEGQMIEIAMYDVATNLLANFGMNYLISGKVPHRQGNIAPLAAPTGLLHTSEGSLYISCANDRSFGKLAEALQRPEIATDPRFASNEARVRNRDALNDLLQEIMQTKPVTEWIDLFVANGIPAGAVHDLAQAFSHPITADRNLVTEIETSSGALVPTVSNPMKFSKTPTVIHAAPPKLGEHNDLRHSFFDRAAEQR